MTNLLLRPNASSGVPIYLQLVDQVREALETGVLAPGEALPAPLPLAEALVINPNAVTRAYLELERVGVVRRSSDGAAVLMRPESNAPVALPGNAPLGNDHLAHRPSALARENRRLTAAVASGVAERAKWTLELSLAREVQQHLFPRQAADCAGLECAGACRPALGVGGDYYDFLALSDHKAGIAIGDISGKGTSAALLMATLRAYVRSQAADASSDIASLVSRLNQLVFDSSTANRFASFFYAQYDGTTHRLDYVNAGHPAVLIFSARDHYSHPRRLEAGGPVIGLMPGCTFTQGSVSLGSGDLLVAFTDGISEAMSASGDEWGEQPLLETLAAHADRPLDEIIRTVMQNADAFAAGAPQHDDMTVVAVRIR